MSNNPENDNNDPPPRELTEREKAIQKLQAAIAEFAQSPATEKGLPGGDLNVVTHHGRIRVDFSPDAGRETYVRMGTLELLSSMCSRPDITLHQDDMQELVDACISLAHLAWDRIQLGRSPLSNWAQDSSTSAETSSPSPSSVLPS